MFTFTLPYLTLPVQQRGRSGLQVSEWSAVPLTPTTNDVDCPMLLGVIFQELIQV